MESLARQLAAAKVHVATTRRAHDELSRLFKEEVSVMTRFIRKLLLFLVSKFRIPSDGTKYSLLRNVFKHTF